MFNCTNFVKMKHKKRANDNDNNNNKMYNQLQIHNDKCMSKYIARTQ